MHVTITYLDNSGFTVEWGDQCLIFDYYNLTPREGTLSDGVVRPADIKKKHTTFFVSHSHYDHYHPGIFDLEKEIDGVYPTEHITREEVEKVLQSFVGTIQQIPPVFSACKVDGKRAYELARKGEEVELKSKTLVIDEMELLECDLPVIKIRVVCSKGTYIRALARDIGVALQSGAHLIALERTRIGDITLAKCMSPDDIDTFLDENIIIRKDCED